MKTHLLASSNVPDSSIPLLLEDLGQSLVLDFAPRFGAPHVHISAEDIRIRSVFAGSLQAVLYGVDFA